jgi:hypothetical protein
MDLVYPRDVRPFIESEKKRKWADKLFYFHSTQRVLLRHEGGQACYFDHPRDKWIMLDGITGIMKREIWKRAAPRSAARSATRRAMQRSAARSASRIAPRSAPRSTARAPQGRRSPLQRMPGFMQGSLVHRQIAQVLEQHAKPTPQLCATLHPYAKATIQAVLARDWMPVACEYPVFDPALNTTTRIDMVAVREDGVLVFIELKTGYSDGRFTSASGDEWRGAKLSAISDQFPCNERNRAVVQVVLGAAMAIKMLDLPQSKVAAAVIRVDMTYKPTVIDVDPTFLGNLSLILHELLVASRMAAARKRAARK